MEKAYYAIIPASVRYDKDLTPNAKLLYGEITALCNEKGYCWASNSYFAELYNVSKNTISRLINVLVDKGYIRAEILYDNKKNIERKLFINSAPILKNDDTYIQKYGEGIIKNGEDNNTINNTINKYTSSDIEDIWNLYPNKKGKAKSLEYISKILKKHSKKDLIKAVERYSLEVKDCDKQFILNGSTFFYSRYVDYLDDNYSQINSNTSNIDSNGIRNFN